MSPSTGIVETGVANTASVTAALRRAGVEPTTIEDAETVSALDRVVVPGVGAFGAGMAALHDLGVVDALIDRVDAGEPTFLVCLGMQLLARISDESPGVDGLGVIDHPVERFPEGVTTPQFGWNVVDPAAEMVHIEPGYAYFANSYRIVDPPDGWRYAFTDHGGPFVAAMERDDVLACQFHPELSGAYGQRVIDRWIAGVDA